MRGVSPVAGYCRPAAGGAGYCRPAAGGAGYCRPAPGGTDLQPLVLQSVYMSGQEKSNMSGEGLWVAQALRGDQRAFAQLVDIYKTAVYNLCYRMLGNAPEAEDAAQETFVRVYTHLKTYDPQQKLSSWILAVASHYCVDRLRRRRITWVSLDEGPAPEPVSAGVVHPEDVVMESESSAEIRHWLQLLPADYRLVITLRYWQDLSYTEIAEVTGASESAVKSKLHRARCMLAQQVLAQRNLQTEARYEARGRERVIENAVL